MSADTWDRDQRVIADKRAELMVARLTRLQGSYQQNNALEFLGSQVADDLEALLDWFIAESRSEATAEVEKAA